MDDRELVRQAQNGDSEAYGRLVDLHQPRVYATLAKITHDRDLALDLTQEAFIRAWEELDGFERRSAFSTGTPRGLQGERWLELRLQGLPPAERRQAIARLRGELDRLEERLNNEGRGS